MLSRDDYAGRGNLWNADAAFASDTDVFVGDLCRLNPRPGTVEVLLGDPDYLARRGPGRAGECAAGCAASDYAEEYLDAAEWGRFRGQTCDAPRASGPR